MDQKVKRPSSKGMVERNQLGLLATMIENQKTKTNYKDVDALGIIKAKIVDLQKQEKEIRDRLIAKGVGSYEGDLFRATISESERSTLDLEAVRKKLTPRFIKAHTCVTEVITVRVSARNGENIGENA